MVPQGIDFGAGLARAAAVLLFVHTVVESLVGKLPEHTEGVEHGLSLARERWELGKDLQG